MGSNNRLPERSQGSHGSEAVETGVSRRAVIGKFVGVTVGAVGAGLLAAAPAAANTGSNVVAGQLNTAGASTTLEYNGTSALAGVVLLANDTSYVAADAFHRSALGGWAGDHTTTGVYGYTYATLGIGVVGDDASAVSGGIGVYATSMHGNALQVSGRASFNRSGGASVPKNRSYVDVIVPGGLASGANVLATVQTYRVGVWVAGVRKNFPSAGKARIYLNKVASRSAATPVAWFVLG